LQSSGLGYSLVVGSYEYGNESSDSVTVFFTRHVNIE
jgi:hypothetical protein